MFKFKPNSIILNTNQIFLSRKAHEPAQMGAKASLEIISLRRESFYHNMDVPLTRLLKLSLLGGGGGGDLNLNTLSEGGLLIYELYDSPSFPPFY